jgi:DNA-binding IclR family transcriptional regulator
LTHTLTRLGYLRYSDYLEKYQLGVGVLALGYRYLSSVGVRDVARPYMRSLADKTDCLVALGTADRAEMTYIEVCQGNGPLVLRLEVGSRIPLLSSAMGRAFLVGLREDRREQYMRELAGMTGIDLDDIRTGVAEAVAYYERHGFCIAEGEWDEEISGVGVPLVLESGSQVLAFNIGGAALRLDTRTLEEGLGPALVRMVARVRAVLSGDETRRS